MEIIKKSWIDHGTQDATFSVVTQEFLVKDDDTQIAIGDQHRQAVTPLDRDKLDNIDPSLKNALLAFWTDDVVEAYKEHMASLAQDVEEAQDLIEDLIEDLTGD